MGFTPRTFDHPGPRASERICAVSASTLASRRLQLSPRTDLFEFLGEWVERHDLSAVAFRLLHGEFEALELLTGKPDLDRGRVATFHGPHVVRCPAHVLECHGIVGVAGLERRIHAHGVFLDATGLARGCHLIPGRSVVGNGGLVLALYCIDNACFRAMPDLETGFDLLCPMPRSGRAPEGDR